jgi:hypothetical protein
MGNIPLEAWPRLNFNSYVCFKYHGNTKGSVSKKDYAPSK